MTFWHKIQKSLFEIDFFFVFSEWRSFLASGGHKTRKTFFSGPKIFCLNLKIVSFVILRPPGAENDILAL